MTEKLFKKCLDFQHQRLRAPPEHLVLRWGHALGLSSRAILQVSQTLDLRHSLGKLKT